MDSNTGEWFSELYKNGHAKSVAVVSAWKCPYHNGRMCVEMIKRLAETAEDRVEN